MPHIDPDTLREDLARQPGRVSELLRQAQEDPQRLSMLQRMAVRWAELASLGDPTASDMSTVLTLTARSGALNLNLAARPDEYVVAELGVGAPVVCKGTGPNSTTHVWLWCESFQFACISRDLVALRWLLDTPTDVLRKSSSQADEFAYLYVDALRAFWQREPRAGELLIAALRATDPARLEYSDPDLVSDIVVPEMECFFYLIQSDAGELNRALDKALALHADYWGRDGREDESDGLIAWGPLAMAALGHDRGLSITIHSGLLPAPLVEGAWSQ